MHDGDFNNVLVSSSGFASVSGGESELDIQAARAPTVVIAASWTNRRRGIVVSGDEVVSVFLGMSPISSQHSSVNGVFIPEYLC